MVNDAVASIRTQRVPLRSSQPAACERVMFFTLTLPVARSFIVTVSVQVAPCLIPQTGNRGKKLRNDPTIGDTAYFVGGQGTDRAPVATVVELKGG